MNELKPCPFCGGEALMRERYINGIANTKHYRRECRHCKATFAHWFRSIKRANEAWNRRASNDTNVATDADYTRNMKKEE
jgi:Lar family restriction alleviation protein